MYFLYTCKFFIIFEVSKYQRNRYVHIAKSNTYISNTKPQTDYFNLFEVEKRLRCHYRLGTFLFERSFVIDEACEKQQLP